jgi:hypothetical protein
MTSFIPDNEDPFPQVHELVDSIFDEGFVENIYNEATEHVPTEYETLENFLFNNIDGFNIRDVPEISKQIDTLIKAVKTFGMGSRKLFDTFISISAKVGDT